MKILILGSYGFIGSALLKECRISSTEVWGADVVNDYADKKYFKIDNIETDFPKIFSSEKFDLCINCAGAASVPDSILNPLRDYRLNVFLVSVLLNALRMHNPACKLIHLSSAAVYGNPKVIPVSENAVENPISPYGVHKMQSEQLCKSFHTFYNIPVAIVRIFSAYGAGLKKQLFWDVCQKIKESQELNFFGTGKETRDFIHVKDICNALMLIGEKSAFTGDIYNVANGEQISTATAINTIAACMNTDKQVSFMGESRSGDPLNWQADISKMAALGYKTSITLKDGLTAYAEWVKELK
jgi:UDP-glucose 4-epimerase